jgi:hypothetical protein
VSFTRNYSRTVSGSETITISYPASEKGGSVSETVRIDIPVNIEIEVDTAPLDSSVGHCRRNVDVLAGAVVATGAANVAAINHSSNLVSKSVTDGFFRLIRSEISQQATEYATRCDALFLKLDELKKACLAKKLQMEADFHRKANQYTNLFSDLDSELTRRIQTLDKLAFDLSSAASLQSDRSFSGVTSMVPAVSGTEDSRNRSALLTTRIRSRVLDTIHKTSAFLAGDRLLTASFRSILRQDAPNGVNERSLPVIYMYADGAQSGVEKLTTGPALAAPGARDALLQRVRSADREWIAMDSRTRSAVDSLLSKRVSDAITSSDAKQTRVGEMILSLWQVSRPLTLANDALKPRNSGR